MILENLIALTENTTETADNGIYKIAAELGLTLDAFIFYLICFSITFAVLSYFLFKPLLQLIKNRQEQIASNIDKENDLEGSIKLLQVEKETYKENIYHEKAKIIEEAKIEAKNTANGIIADADTKSFQITAQAEKDAAQIRDNAKSQAEKEVIAFYSKMISNNLTKFNVSAQQATEVMNSLLTKPIK
jgi:F-type H+-transporting ATPase subunit b